VRSRLLYLGLILGFCLLFSACGSQDGSPRGNSETDSREGNSTEPIAGRQGTPTEVQILMRTHSSGNRVEVEVTLKDSAGAPWR